LAVFVVTPFVVYLAATKTELEDWERGALAAIAAGTLVVDGGLLLAYMKKRRQSQGS
jgi:hypothetical protein